MDKRWMALGLAGTIVTGAAGQATANDETETDEGLDLRADFSEAVANGPLGYDGSMPIQAMDFDPYVYHSGPYLVGYLSTATIIDTDFNGNQGVADPGMTEAVFLVEFDPGIGFAAGIGYRFNEFAVELFYERTSFDTNLAGSDFDEAVMHTVNLEAKYFFMTDTPLQPYAQLGFVLPWLDTYQSAVAPVPPAPPTAIGDGEFSGFGVSVGAGVSYYLTPKIAITGNAGWRQIWLNRVEGVNGVEYRPHSGTYNASGLFARAGVVISF